MDTDTQRVRLEQLCRNRVVGWRLSEGASVAADGERGGVSAGHRYTACAPGADGRSCAGTEWSAGDSQRAPQ